MIRRAYLRSDDGEYAWVNAESDVFRDYPEYCKLPKDLFYLVHKHTTDKGRVSTAYCHYKTNSEALQTLEKAEKEMGEQTIKVIIKNNEVTLKNDKGECFTHSALNSKSFKDFIGFKREYKDGDLIDGEFLIANGWVMTDAHATRRYYKGLKNGQFLVTFPYSIKACLSDSNVGSASSYSPLFNFETISDYKKINEILITNNL